MRSSRRSDPQFFLIEVEGLLDALTFKTFYCRINRLSTILELHEYRVPVRSDRVRWHRCVFIVKTSRRRGLKNCLHQLGRHRNVNVTIKPIQYETPLPIY